MNDKIVVRMFKLFFPFSKKILYISLCLLVIASISLLMPILNKMMIDEGIYNKDFVTILKICIFLILIGIVYSVAEIVKEKNRASISASIQKKIYVDALDSLMNIKIEYFDSKNSTEIFHDMEIDISKISSIFDSSMVFIVTQFLSFIGGMIGLFVIDVRLAVLLLMFFPFKFFIVYILAKKSIIYLI